MTDRQEAQVPRIHVMPQSLANKIAAGEVVARPASALKELLENSLDAGAKRISADIRRAGSLQIAVTDDGTGMGPQDAVRCFARHATSKIRSVDELDQIWTLGFRGEALASVAAISQVTLTTRRAEDAQGHLVRVHGGEVIASEPCAATTGTRVDVRNLFYNVPARRAFLKSPATEFSHISDAFLAQALAHPRIAFSLAHNKNVVFRMNACLHEDDSQALRARVGQFVKPSFASRLIAIREETSYISVYGLTCRTEAMRRSRKERYMYVNGRIVRSPSLQHAVMSAYEGLVSKRRFPFYVLFIRIDPRHVDVNVHPAKSEVQFSNDRDVYRFVRAVVRKALGTADMVPNFDPNRRANINTAQAWGSKRSSTVSTPDSGGATRSAGEASDLFYRPSASKGKAQSSKRTTDGSQPKRSGEKVAGNSKDSASHTRPRVWQLHNHYICTPLRTGLMILDQRAAHERILYERALESIKGGEGPSQQLLFTEATALGSNDMAIFEELAPMLKASGFNAERSGPRTVTVRGVPEGMHAGHEKFLLKAVIAEFRDFAEEPNLSVHERLALCVARKGAIPPGTALSGPEMLALIDRLFLCQEPYTSPNGRPALLRITLDELSRRFSKPTQ